MGVDLIGIIGHSLTKKQLFELPKKMEGWQDFHAYYNATSNYPPTNSISWNGTLKEEELERVWQYYEGKTEGLSLEELDDLDPSLGGRFGELYVHRNTFTSTHALHKYHNLSDPIRGKNILWLNRLIAQHLGSKEVLYCPDSGYPTQIIGDTALEGWTYEQIKAHALKEFGTPPRGAEEGRKYFFFIDYLEEPLEPLTEWNINESPYWQYNTQTNAYELLTPPSKD